MPPFSHLPTGPLLEQGCGSSAIFRVAMKLGLGGWQRGGKEVTSMLGTDMSAKPDFVPALMEPVI